MRHWQGPSIVASLECDTLEVRALAKTATTDGTLSITIIF